MKTQKAYLNPVTGHGPFRVNQESRKENILFISVDMVPREFYQQFEGCVEMHTPHLDTLKQNHVVFENAFCSSPLCSPSRASYLSGHYSYITVNSERAHDGQDIHVRQEDILFPEYLKHSGYHCRHAGKSHVGTHKFMDIFGENDSPWDRWSPPWFDDDQYINYLKNLGFERISFEKTLYGQEAAGEGRGNCYGGWVAPQNGKPFPKEATYPAYLVQKTIDALEARQDAEQPFYFQLDFFGPHQPFAIPAGMEKREQELREIIRLPESYQQIHDNNFQAPWDEPRVYRMYRKNWGLTDPETLKSYMIANILQFELLDEMIGRLFAYLQEQGTYHKTWIFLIADHGEMNGEMALIDKGAYLNPGVIRVPLLIKPPADSEFGQQSYRIEEPVSLLDLAPTMLEIAGISTDARMDGVSLLQSLVGAQRPDRKPILFDIWSHVVPNPSIGMVFTASNDKNYMFTFNVVDEIDELYELENRKSLHNLIAEPEASGIVQEALVKMDEVLERDPRWISYSGPFKLTYAERLPTPFGDQQHFL
ncbi:hypothetical protein CSA56_03660 [candidate division KSB3 bacterium]|uniref:Sulfatase N-terminal domain-containing protein n=1 Tax=candidate division KSB3 bacterium TaxID=2044937 RepID=A0A2G6KIT3_9BACT|nr:MAG: hypothetical protein CSA56_03660 [candidate division KSB3 bacterium]